MLIVRLIDLYTIVVLAAVVLSWTGTPRTHPLAVLVRVLTEPVLAPMRRVLPPVGALDFSPMILLIALRLLRGVLRG